MKIKLSKVGSKKLEAFYRKEWGQADLEHYGRDIPWEMWHAKKFTLEAYEGMKIVGALYFSINADVAYIDMIIVTKTQRRKGVGAVLMKKAEELAGKNGAHKIYLQTGKSWDSVRFYESLGYKKTGELPDHYFHTDYVEMTKFLDKK